MNYLLKANIAKDNTIPFGSRNSPFRLALFHDAKHGIRLSETPLEELWTELRNIATAFFFHSHLRPASWAAAREACTLTGKEGQGGWNRGPSEVRR
jgi:hypothetical protein